MINREKKPHVHAEVIKAWADGATVQARRKGSEWRTAVHPRWYTCIEYRVKPEPVVRWQWAVANTTGDALIRTRMYYTEAELDAGWRPKMAIRIEESRKEFES